MSEQEKQGLEMAQCAYVNFNNFERFNPGVGKHPMYVIAKTQLRDAIEKMSGSDEFCANQDTFLVPR